MTGISLLLLRKSKLRLALGLPSVANLARLQAERVRPAIYRSVRFPFPHFGTIKPPFGGFYVPIGGDDGNRTRVPQGSPYACTSIADVRLRDADRNGAKSPNREKVPVPAYR